MQLKLSALSLAMSDKKSYQNVISARHMVAAHEFIDCRSESELRTRSFCGNPPAKQYKV